MITVEGLEIKLIHTEKVLFPDDGIAKGGLSSITTGMSLKRCFPTRRAGP
jgi:hypothetical protein